MIGARVCYTNVLGFKRYGRIVTTNDSGYLVKVAWEAWPEYLASLSGSPLGPTEEDRRYCAAHSAWAYMPGVKRVAGASLELVPLAK